jgi:hypothetical protein
VLGRRSTIPATVNGMVAAPARTIPRRALWQQLWRCGARGDGTLPYLPLRPVRTDVSNSSNPPEDITAVRCTPTLEATTVRVQDMP